MLGSGYDPRCNPKITGPSINDDTLIWLAHKEHAWLAVPMSMVGM